jgi:hypothetical protein
MSTKRTRVANDFYPTPEKLITAWLKENQILMSLNDRIFDGCAGEGVFQQVLEKGGYTNVFSSDITQPAPEGYGSIADVTDEDYWEFLDQTRGVDWFITNPPYTLATTILRLALKYARRGVILLLRSSYIEPCKDRRDVLLTLDETTIVNPRPRFRSDTKGSDSSTVGFFVWRDVEERKRQVFHFDPTIKYLVDWHKQIS